VVKTKPDKMTSKVIINIHFETITIVISMVDRV